MLFIDSLEKTVYHFREVREFTPIEFSSGMYCRQFLKKVLKISMCFDHILTNNPRKIK
jgi:hypothetical protein